MQWVNQQAEKAGVYETVVLVAANRYSRMCAEYYVRPGMSCYFLFDKGFERPLASKYDYYVSIRRHGWHKKFPNAPVVHVVGRQGAIFTVIKDLNSRQP